MSSLPVPRPGKGTQPTPVGSRKDSCQKCGEAIEHWYFRVNGAMHCLACAKSEHSAGTKDTETAYTRALLFGGGAALVGIILYSAFGIATGWMWGYLTFAMGAIIGKMMMVGSKGIGGRRYQWTAVILTYATVSLSAVPIAVVYESRRRAAIRAQATALNLAEEQHRLEEEFGSGTNQAAARPARPASPQKSAPRFEANPGPPGRSGGPVFRPTPMTSPAAVLGSLAILGLFSPFLALMMPIQGGLQLIVLIVGMLIAWRGTAGKRTEITGPFRT
jgi:hypothetical protein